VAVIGLVLFLRWRRNPVVSSEQDAAYGADNGLLVAALVPAGTADPDQSAAPPSVPGQESGEPDDESGPAPGP
jgi:hypothetical protein